MNDYIEELGFDPYELWEIADSFYDFVRERIFYEDILIAQLKAIKETY